MLLLIIARCMRTAEPRLPGARNTNLLLVWETVRLQDLQRYKICMRKAKNPIEVTLVAQSNRDYLVSETTQIPQVLGTVSPPSLKRRYQRAQTDFSPWTRKDSWLSRMTDSTRWWQSTGWSSSTACVCKCSHKKNFSVESHSWEWAVLVGLQLINLVTSFLHTCSSPVLYLPR